MIKKIKIVFLLALSTLFIGCNEFDKIQKSSDYEMKYTKAMEYYDSSKNYNNAALLFEELIPVFATEARGEQMYYKLCYCHYNVDDFGLAAYYFRQFYRKYPLSDKAEECSFMSAFCYTKNSPKSSLDQTDTKYAIDELQGFINDFPSSSRVDTCNKIIDVLRAKIEKKEYEIAKQYYNLEDYKAAITEGQNFVKAYPGSAKLEEIEVMIIKSYYQYANKSLEKKKLERTEKGIEYYLKFVDLHPNSKYIDEAQSAYSDMIKLKTQLEKK